MRVPPYTEGRVSPLRKGGVPPYRETRDPFEEDPLFVGGSPPLEEKAGSPPLQGDQMRHASGLPRSATKNQAKSLANTDRQGDGSRWGKAPKTSMTVQE